MYQPLSQELRCNSFALLNPSWGESAAEGASPPSCVLKNQRNHRATSIKVTLDTLRHFKRSGNADVYWVRSTLKNACAFFYMQMHF